MGSTHNIDAAPSTPARPARCVQRLHIRNEPSTSSLAPALSDPLMTMTPPLAHSLPASPVTPATPTPVTPTTPTTALTRPQPAYASPSASSAARKSVISVRRKPVPSESGAIDDAASAISVPLQSRTLRSHSSDALFVALDDAHASLECPPPMPAFRAIPPRSSSFDLQPPRYILPVDPPVSRDVDAVVGPSVPAPPSYSPRTSAPQPDVAFTINGGRLVPEDLPTYAPENQTEPKTLARALWRWGFVCPILWFIGMFIIWIPLRPVEEELDPEKAQKLDEMIVLIREAELKYAKRCCREFVIFCLLILAVVVAAVVVSVTRK